MAHVPNATQASVDPRKVTHYLLSATHPRGGPKAAFIESFGFSLRNWQRLHDALREHLLANDYESLSARPNGRFFRLSGPLPCPDGQNPLVVVIWQIRNGEARPRLVTAFPG